MVEWQERETLMGPPKKTKSHQKGKLQARRTARALLQNLGVETERIEIKTTRWEIRIAHQPPNYTLEIWHIRQLHQNYTIFSRPDMAGTMFWSVTFQ